MIAMTALKQGLEANERLYSGWCNMGDAQITEVIARAPFGAVTIDMQHGGIGFEQARAMTTSVTMAGKPAIVRIPVGEFSMASRALDFGAQAIIAPMINCRQDAEQFVAAVKYPPIGERSYAPMRACDLFGIEAPNDYVRAGNDACLAFAMIETMHALDNLDEILAVPGLDGLFMGPADMSLTLLKGEKVDMDNEAANEIYKKVARVTLDAGKMPAIYAPTSDYANRFSEYGYRLIAIGSDAGYLRMGMAQVLESLHSLKEK